MALQLYQMAYCIQVCIMIQILKAMSWHASKCSVERILKNKTPLEHLIHTLRFRLKCTAQLAFFSFYTHYCSQDSSWKMWAECEIWWLYSFLWPGRWTNCLKRACGEVLSVNVWMLSHKHQNQCHVFCFCPQGYLVSDWKTQCSMRGSLAPGWHPSWWSSVWTSSGREVWMRRGSFECQDRPTWSKSFRRPLTVETSLCLTGGQRRQENTSF